MPGAFSFAVLNRSHLPAPKSALPLVEQTPHEPAQFVRIERFRQVGRRRSELVVAGNQIA